MVLPLLNAMTNPLQNLRSFEIGGMKHYVRRTKTNLIKDQITKPS